MFISHEGLQLNYEEALTRPSPAPPGSFPGPHSRAGSAAGGLSLGGARAEAGAPTTPVAPPAATAHRMRTPSQELNEQASALAAAAHAHALSKVFAGPKVYYNLGEQLRQAQLVGRAVWGATALSSVDAHQLPLATHHTLAYALYDRRHALSVDWRPHAADRPRAH